MCDHDGASDRANVCNGCGGLDCLASPFSALATRCRASPWDETGKTTHDHAFKNAIGLHLNNAAQRNAGVSVESDDDDSEGGTTGAPHKKVGLTIEGNDVFLSDDFVAPSKGGGSTYDFR